MICCVIVLSMGCDPLRWHLAIAAVLRMGDFRCRIDVCVFPKRMPGNADISAFPILYVDDILICASFRDLELLWEMIATAFRTGPLNYFLDATLVVCGLQLRHMAQSVCVSQDEYRVNMPELNRAHVFFERRFLRTEKLGGAARAVVGSCIWMCQTRYDIAF